MDNDDAHVAGDFFLHPIVTTQRKTFLEHCQRYIPRQTIIHIQYCLLRVPFILMYDYLFTEKFASSIESLLNYAIRTADDHHHWAYQPISYLLHSYLFQILLTIGAFIVIPLLGLVPLILLLLCSNRRLVIFYSYTISFLVIYLDYQMTKVTDSQASSINTYILQFLLSSIYVQMLNIRPRVRSYRLQTRLCHCAPIVLIVTRYLVPTYYSTATLKSYYFVWTAVHLMELCIYHRDSIVNVVRNRFLNELYHLYDNFGLQVLMNYLQARIFFVTLLKIFWLAKIIVLPLCIRTIHKNPYVTRAQFNASAIGNGTINANGTSSIEHPTLSPGEIPYDETLIKTIYFTSLFYGTETVFTLMSLACLVSHAMKSISHRLFRLLHLWTEDVEQIGTAVGVMVFLLLFQSNITRIDLHRRHVPLLKAFSLLIVALFHFLHTILEPQLLKVAMQTMTTRMAFNQADDDDDDTPTDQKNDNEEHRSSLLSSPVLRAYHHRHVYTCLSILVLVIAYMAILWRLTTLSTWLLAVTAFSLELIVRLLASLTQFTIYVLDAHNRLPHTDSFDEYIFRTKAVASCFEFILGVFLLFNGFYILCFESQGALRALMLAIHAYLNIIKNLRRGWQICRNRKSAWDHVHRLPVATDEQIEEYNDICPICHNTLTAGAACVTPCAHIFHQKCLQKAFYATQNCALCSRPIVPDKHEHRE